MIERWRHVTLLVLTVVGAVAILGRTGYLQLYQRPFLVDESAKRAVREVVLPTHRGIIRDRHGEPLAVSTPLASLWTHPGKLLSESRESLGTLAELLGMPPDRLLSLLRSKYKKEFVYLRRGVQPRLAQQVLALKLAGISVQQEYRRYYPAGEILAQVVGFTNIDDDGQEGLELSFDDWLKGRPGKKRVLVDSRRRTVRDIESILVPEPGRDLHLSIDRRLQYLAYRELLAAMHKNSAMGGALVMLNPRTGEVLAMVSLPSYNPNDRRHLSGNYSRNVAVTDVFEPGSTIKPFTVLAALLSGEYTAESELDTAPGWLMVDGHTIRDFRNYGLLSLAQVIKKSSNVGASMLSLALEPGQLWGVLDRAGIGRTTASGFPGESSGHLLYHERWPRSTQASVSYGYGLSTTCLQLARAYAVFATGGRLPQVVMQRLTETPDAPQVFPAGAVLELRDMMEGVVDPGGTGSRAAVAKFRIAGKTGTVHKITAQGYAEDRYLALFAGMAPASDPQLVMVVMLDEPSGGDYYGGLVAAPIFSRVMAGSLRLLNVPPDDFSGLSPETIVRVERG